MKDLVKRHVHNKFDVIVVLGAAVWGRGRASPALRRRVHHAVELMRKGKSNFMLVTGGLGVYAPAEAKVMRDLALDEGIPRESIIVEDEGTSTFQSILQCTLIMRARGWSRALVVSDPYHIYRAILVFWGLGMRAIGSAARGGRKANPLWKWCYYYMRELLALPWCALLVLTTRAKRLVGNL